MTAKNPWTPAQAFSFRTTHWSVVLMAASPASSQSAEALEKLCRSYWYPVYLYVRRRGHAPADAEDLTQEFFARLLEKNYLSTVDRRRGRFRSFLLGSVNHFLANEWDKARTEKRGGKITFVSLNMGTSGRRHQRQDFPATPTGRARIGLPSRKQPSSSANSCAER